MKLSLVDRGRISREVHVRICEGVGVNFPPPRYDIDSSYTAQVGTVTFAAGLYLI